MRRAFPPSPSQRERERKAARQRHAEQAVAEAERERREREESAQRQRGEREERDRQTRARAFEVNHELALARRAAEDAQLDLEAAAGRLASGEVTMDRLQALQGARDEARRVLEIYGLAATEMGGDPALVGRR
ncbi:MAG: hypothetical protein JWN32_497 [Solirubrobacterales bacterium]|nr:hypothetical protein [Solirubrobacterales bacterium]